MAATKRVLLTGASGFIGRHEQSRLLELGYDVHAVGFRARDDWAHPGVHTHVCDLMEERECAALFRSVRPSHLLHLAWCATPGAFWTSLENLQWVSASLALTRAFAEAGGSRAVYAGTCAEYDWSTGWCSENETPLRPHTLYGTCKHALQSIFTQAQDELGLSIGWGRLFFMYGSHEPPGRLVSSIATALLQDDPVACTDGRQVRDFMHVQDVADALAALLDSPVTGPVNIATGVGRPVADIIRLIGEATKKPGLVQWGQRNAQRNEPERIEADVSRLANEVIFTPRFTLADGIDHTVAWWRAQLKPGP
jgi:nucleoside-diphosphate-sugar epimerase